MTSPREGPSPGELELTVERLTYGPETLAREPSGRVVFLDGGLPGETVRACLTEQHRDYARAHVTAILAPATTGGARSSRREPPCPVVERCGGCPWQHLGYEAQLEQKLGVALREIARAARLEPERVLPSIGAREWGGRHRVRLGVARDAAGALDVGYRARSSEEIVPIVSCAIADPALVAALPAARAVAAADPNLVDIELILDDRGALMLRAWSDSRAPREAPALLEVARGAGIEVVGVRVESSERRRAGDPAWRSVAGDVVQHVGLPDGTTLHVPLGVFTQVSLAGNRSLVTQLLEQVKPRVGMRVLDLFCGAGNFTLPLARAGASVSGIEGNPEAAEAAQRNAARLGLDATVSVTCGDVAEVIRTARVRAGECEAIVLDPPRAGARRAISRITRLGAARIVYVACDVASFARDARALAQSGYRFESFQVVDLTPQSYRAEGIGGFRLT